MVLESADANAIGQMKSLMFAMMNRGLENPVIIRRDYGDAEEDRLIIAASIELGAMLLAGFADGIWIDSAPVSTARETQCNRSQHTPGHTPAHLQDGVYLLSGLRTHSP